MNELWNLVSRFGTIWLLIGFGLARVAVRGRAEARSRLGLVGFLLGLHVVLLPAAATLVKLQSRISQDLVVLAGFSGALAGVGIAGVLVFEGIVLRVRPTLPRIVPDVITTAAAFATIVRVSSSFGVELSGIIATSAVLTAVIGLSLQDTLGNILGGLAIQLDQSLEVGDWVKLGDVSGRVAEIRWRYTAIETRNWETVLVPNSVVTKSQVVVLGRRQGQPIQWRRWVHFDVGYQHAPSRVTEVVERALREQSLPNVAATPPPNCIVSDLGASTIRYSIRYWLTDLAVDDPTDSSVRTRLFFALARAEIPFSYPTQNVLVAQLEGGEVERAAADRARRIDALRKIDLFVDLADEELAELAANLQRVPFARGETITREGAEAHYLYTIVGGEVSVRTGGVEEANEVSRLRAGQFFGEMALLTGERRRATCIASTDVECYRLDASAFRELLHRRPDLAERVAHTLAERQLGLTATRERLDEAQRQSLIERNERDILGRIRGFFKLGD